MPKPIAWSVFAYLAVREVACQFVDLTTDDVWRCLARHGIDPPIEPRAMGNVMSEARRNGIVLRTRRTVETERRKAHNRPLRIWTSRIIGHPFPVWPASKRDA